MIVSNLTHLARFLSWVGNLPVGIHLGREIRRRALELDFLKFFITQPVLYFYAHVFIDGENEPLEGFVVSMTVDPENNLFSVRILNEQLTNPLECDIALDQLIGLDQLSTDHSVERARSIVSPPPRLIIKDELPNHRRFECSQILTTLRHQL